MSSDAQELQKNADIIQAAMPQLVGAEAIYEAPYGIFQHVRVLRVIPDVNRRVVSVDIEILPSKRLCLNTMESHEVSTIAFNLSPSFTTIYQWHWRSGYGPYGHRLYFHKDIIHAASLLAGHFEAEPEPFRCYNVLGHFLEKYGASPERHESVLREYRDPEKFAVHLQQHIAAGPAPHYSKFTFERAYSVRRSRGHIEQSSDLSTLHSNRKKLASFPIEILEGRKAIYWSGDKIQTSLVRLWNPRFNEEFQSGLVNAEILPAKGLESNHNVFTFSASLIKDRLETMFWVRNEDVEEPATCAILFDPPLVDAVTELASSFPTDWWEGSAHAVLWIQDFYNTYRCRPSETSIESLIQKYKSRIANEKVPSPWPNNTPLLSSIDESNPLDMEAFEASRETLKDHCKKQFDLGNPLRLNVSSALARLNEKKQLTKERRQPDPFRPL